MKINLSGKQALVTGASSGIGFAIAQGLAQAGAQVSMVARDQARLADAVEKINALCGTKCCEGIAADAATDAGCKQIIAAKTQVDILVNNLGIFPMKPFFDINDEDWQSIFQVNVMSGVRLARHYAKTMQQQAWGRIQFISSESALNIPTEMVHYGVTKAAVQAVARGLAKVLAGSGVTVNSILPGPTLTENIAALCRQIAQEKGISEQAVQQEFLQQNRPSSIIKRMALPEEVANFCVYMASEQASATTGSALRVDGGIVETIA